MPVGGGETPAIDPFLEALLERARRVSQSAEVFHVRRRDDPVMFEANRLKLVESRESSGVALRMVKDGKIGFSSTSDFRDPGRLVDKALEMGPYGPETRLEFPAYHEFPPVDVYDGETVSMPVEDMAQMGQAAVDRLVRHTSDLTCDGVVAKGVTTVTVLNSSGGAASYTKSVFSVFLHGTVVKGEDMLLVSDGKSWCRPIRDTADIVESIETQLDLSRTVVDAPVGAVPVVFSARGFAGALLSPLMSGFSGKAVLQGVSPLVGKQGQRLMDQRFSLWDDPQMAYAPGSRMCDDEGMPTRKLSLVDRGAIGAFLYDLQTAAQAGVESTASAHRGVSSLPSPGSSVIVVDGGDTSYEEMLRDMGDGLVVERLLGAGQSNILGGDFNANVLLGYRVEGGRVTGRVKNTVISGNVYRVLENVRGIEKETHWVGGSVRVPSLYADSVSVSSK
jgi:PmbA protein